MQLPSIAIVILNWNGKRYLEQFLPSVLSTTYANCKVVVADNASTDDSLQFLADKYPEVVRIKLEKNFGFAQGYNEALRQVTADYYMLLNSDVEVPAGWLEPMIDLLESDASFAACQPKILAFHQKDHFEYAGAAGGWIDLYGYPFARGRVFETCEKDIGQYNRTQEIFWASGAALLIRSKVYHDMSGFDGYLFAHQEEIDLCWRMKNAGYKIFCCPQSVVYHVGGGTLPRGNNRKTFLNFRNNHILLAKNLSRREAVWKIPYRLLLDQVSAFKELISGNTGFFTAVFKAHLAFFYWLCCYKKSVYLGRRNKLKNLTGVYKGNVVWQYFVKKKKYFNQLVSKEFL